MRKWLGALALVASLAPVAAFPQADADTLRTAKALFFDRRYDEAREAWRKVRASGRGDDAQAALYWIARCSENLGESERSLAEYGEYLAGRPADRTLAEEAKTSRVALADLVFKSLPDEAIADLRREGYDARKFWERLKSTGPTEILTVEGGDGERIQVWIE